MIDTHCHVLKEEMNNYLDIIEECNSKDISMIINGYDNKSNREVIELANKYSNVYSSIGLNYDGIDKIFKLENRNIKASEVYNEFSDVFKTYYSEEKYINSLYEKMKELNLL